MIALDPLYLLAYEIHMQLDKTILNISIYYFFSYDLNIQGHLQMSLITLLKAKKKNKNNEKKTSHTINVG